MSYEHRQGCTFPSDPCSCLTPSEREERYEKRKAIEDSFTMYKKDIVILKSQLKKIKKAEEAMRKMLKRWLDNVESYSVRNRDLIRDTETLLEKEGR